MKEAISSAICTRIIPSIFRSSVTVGPGLGAVRKVAFCAFLLGFLACNESNGNGDPLNSLNPAANSVPGTKTEQLQALLEQMQVSVSDASKGAIELLGPHAKTLGNLSSEELSKLFAWRYKVVDLAATTGPEEMERTLGELGAENWECFSILQLTDKIRVSCRKRPASALGYLKHLQSIAQ